MVNTDKEEYKVDQDKPGRTESEGTQGGWEDPRPLEAKPANEAADKKDGFTKKPSKSVTLIDNIRSNVIVRHKRDGSQNKSKDGKCLRGILKSKTDTRAVSNAVDTGQPPVLSYSTVQKTEESIPDPCPKYFGVRSYIDSFYYPPDSDLLNSDDFIRDDFEFVVEPGKRRWRNCWFKVGLWCGINLLLLGIIALLVGHLTPPRETIVARVDNLEILDRSAITFNSRLHLCRLSGITIFCIGGIVLMLTLLISSYQQDASYYVINTALLPDTFTRMQGPYCQKFWTSQIPLSGTLKPVQPR